MRVELDRTTVTPLTGVTGHVLISGISGRPNGAKLMTVSVVSREREITIVRRLHEEQMRSASTKLRFRLDLPRDVEPSSSLAYEGADIDSHYRLLVEVDFGNGRVSRTMDRLIVDSLPGRATLRAVPTQLHPVPSEPAGLCISRQ